MLSGSLGSFFGFTPTAIADSYGRSRKSTRVSVQVCVTLIIEVVEKEINVINKHM